MRTVRYLAKSPIILLDCLFINYLGGRGLKEFRIVRTLVFGIVSRLVLQRLKRGLL